MFGEFRDFATSGNFVDTGVAFVFGAAFTALVSSAVGDMMMPMFGAVLGGVDLSQLTYTIQRADIATGAPAIELAYGAVLDAFISFLFAIFVLFFLVKAVNKARRRRVATEPALSEGAAAARQEQLLEEIRDLLKRSAPDAS